MRADRSGNEGIRRKFFARQPTLPRAIDCGIDMLHQLP